MWRLNKQKIEMTYFRFTFIHCQSDFDPLNINSATPQPYYSIKYDYMEAEYLEAK